MPELHVHVKEKKIDHEVGFQGALLLQSTTKEGKLHVHVLYAKTLWFQLNVDPHYYDVTLPLRKF